MTETVGARIIIEGDAKQVVAEFEKLKRSLGGAESGMRGAKGAGDKLGGTLKSLATSLVGPLSIVAGFTLLTNTFKKAIDSAAEAQRVMAQTEAVIRSTGGVAGLTAQEIGAMAKQFQATTTYSDETVQSMQNILLTFTALGKDIMPQATQVVLDMATALGSDLQGTAIQVGKALQDPILGITALRRVGVNFNQEQTEVIRNLVRTGRAAEAQALIMKELNLEFGGSAAAQVNTYSGAVKQLGNVWDEVLESMGTPVLPTLTLGLQNLSAVLSGQKTYLEGFVTGWRSFLGIIEPTPELLNPILGTLQTMRRKAEDAGFAFGNLGGQVEELEDAVKAVELPSIWDTIFPSPAELVRKMQEQIDFITAGGPQLVAAISTVGDAIAEGLIQPSEAMDLLLPLSEAAAEFQVTLGDATPWEAAKGHAERMGIPLNQAYQDVLNMDQVLRDLPEKIDIQVKLLMPNVPEGYGIPRRQASGGPLANPALVGEAGPELIIDGVVIPASTTRELMRLGLAPRKKMRLGGLVEEGGYVAPTGQDFMKTADPHFRTRSVISAVSGVSGVSGGSTAVAAAAQASEQIAQQQTAIILAAMPSAAAIQQAVVEPTRIQALAVVESNRQMAEKLDVMISLLQRAATDSGVGRAVRDELAGLR